MSGSVHRWSAVLGLFMIIGGCVAREPSATPRPSDSSPRTPPASFVATAAPSTFAPIGSVPPVATPFVSKNDNFLAGLRYTCGGAEFPVELLEAPQHAERSDDPPAALLRGPLFLGEVDSWSLVERAESTAEYVGTSSLSDFGLVYLRAEVFEGAWRASNYGDCQARVVVPNSDIVTWWVPATRWPAPDVRTLDVTVRDECPATVAQRLRDPIVRESQDSIVIVLAADVVPEPHPHCGLTTDKDQRARITISLDTRVGNRSLFDGSSWPLRDAHKQSDPIIWCCG